MTRVALCLPLLLAACNVPDQPEGNETDNQAAAMTSESAAMNNVDPPEAELQPGYGTENAAGDAPDPADPAPAAGAAPGNSTAAADRFSGRWIGVEGMFLNVTPAAAPGRYSLEMQYDLDHKATVEGRATPEGIAFTRGGEQMVLRPSNGDATGLKWLAGKKDCLTVKNGEGYCRA